MYSKEVENNINSWKEIYEDGGFGNQYPSSYLVTLLHRVIKKELPNIWGRKFRVLDFACSYGANSRMLRDAGFDVYGIDISDMAIDHCIEKYGFDSSRFKCINVFEKESLETLFGVKFDLIIASECLYYFSQNDLKRLMLLFKEGLNSGGIIYGNMQTFNFGFYKECNGKKPNEEGMYRIEESGSANRPLFVNLVDSKIEVEKVFSEFEKIRILRYLEEVDEEYESFHYIGRLRE